MTSAVHALCNLWKATLETLEVYEGAQKSWDLHIRLVYQNGNESLQAGKSRV